MKNWDRATVLAILSGGILIGFASAMGVVAITNASSYQEPQQQVAKSQEPQVNQVAQEPAKPLPEVEKPKAEPPPPSDQPTEKEKEFVRKKVKIYGATGQSEEIYWEAMSVNADEEQNQMLGNTQLQLRPGDRGVILHMRSTDGAKWRVGYMAVAFYNGDNKTDIEADIDGRMIRPMGDRPPSKREIQESARKKFEFKIMEEWESAQIEDMNRSPRDRVGVPDFAEYLRTKKVELGIK